MKMGVAVSNEKKRAVYAPDTNFFIQCKNAIDVDWHLVSNADSVLLVVLNEVHREIDRLKSGGNVRRARRAKAISSQLRELIVTGQDEVELRASGPAVSLRLAPRLDPKRMKPDHYDLNSADERIAEEAKTCSDCFFDGGLALLSHDGMPLRAAQLMVCMYAPSQMRGSCHQSQANKIGPSRSSMIDWQHWRGKRRALNFALTTKPLTASLEN